MKNVLSIILMILTAAVLAFSLTCCDNGDLSELDEPIVFYHTETTQPATEPETTDNDEKIIKLKKQETAMYEIIMSEKPEITMWEFANTVNSDGCMKLAEITGDDMHHNAVIYMYKHESNYYLQIVTEIPDMHDASFNYTIQVTENTIDKIWLTIEASVLMHNVIGEQANMNLYDMSVEPPDDVYSHIAVALDEYQSRGFVVTEMDIAAAMDENDWLAAFMSNMLNDTYGECMRN